MYDVKLPWGTLVNPRKGLISLISLTLGELKYTGHNLS